jgi:hypothetical protein
MRAGSWGVPKQSAPRSFPNPTGRLAKRLDGVAAMVPNTRIGAGYPCPPRALRREGAMGFVLMFLGVIFLTVGFFALHCAPRPWHT